MPTALGTVASHRTAAAGGWSPLNLASLECWFDATVASSFTYSNGNDGANPANTYVSQWRDLSGKANHADGNANAGYHPKRNVTINGLTAVDHSVGAVAALKSLGITNYLASETKPSSWFMVVRTAATLVASAVFMGASSSGLMLRLSGTAGALEMLVPGVNSIVTTPVGTVAPSTVYLLGCTYSATGQYEIRKNGVSVVTGTNDRPVSTANIVSHGASSSSGTSSFGGYIGETVICNAVLSPADITALESYLTAKWITPAAFSPLSLPWWSAWWASGPRTAALGLADMAAVASWPDEIASRNWAQADGAKQPSYTTASSLLNNRPGIVPDGTNDYMTQTFSVLAQPFSIVAICAPEDAWQNRYLIDFGIYPTPFLYVPYGNRGWRIMAGAGALNGVTYTAPFTARLFVAYFNAASSATQIDNNPAMTTTGGNLTTNGIPAATGYLFTSDLLGATDYIQRPLAFLGIASGDIRTAPGWGDFVAWAKSYYGVPIP